MRDSILPQQPRDRSLTRPYAKLIKDIVAYGTLVDIRSASEEAADRFYNPVPFRQRLAPGPLPVIDARPLVLLDTPADAAHRLVGAAEYGGDAAQVWLSAGFLGGGNGEFNGGDDVFVESLGHKEV